MHEHVVEVVELLLYTLGSGALAALGLAAEYNGAQHAVSGDLVTAAWFAYVGVISFVAAIALARRKLLDRSAAAA